MPDRIKTIVECIEPVGVLADVGCDHGYCAELALKSGRAKLVYITDISEKSLNKAINLLKPQIGSTVFPVVCYGLDALPDSVEEAVIAGMGGEEICGVLARAHFLPKYLVLNPMKNSEKVRRLLAEKGYGINRDFTFPSGGKYYDIISAELGKTTEYTEKQFKWGGENLNGNPYFLSFISEKLARLGTFEPSGELDAKIAELTEIRNEAARNI